MIGISREIRKIRPNIIKFRAVPHFGINLGLTLKAIFFQNKRIGTAESWAISLVRIKIKYHKGTAPVEK